MNNFQCPFCDSYFALTYDAFKVRYPSFESYDWDAQKRNNEFLYKGDSGLEVYYYKCPQCLQVSIHIKGVGEQFDDGYNFWFYPRSKARQFPEYVPKAIRDDYNEAYSIIDLSPKASATLSRRCIQGMIRDLWNVDQPNLFKEIDAIKENIDPTLWKSLDSIRKIGNIGAHMEKDINLIIDIDPNEAEKLLKLVEMLIRDWYIVPYERDQLLFEIQTIGDNKENQRLSEPSK